MKSLERINLRNPIHLLAVGFGSGLIYPAPGTWGSLAGLLLGWLLLQWLSLSCFIILIVLGFWLGCFLCQRTAQDLGVHDHSSIVWDEIIGIFMVLTLVPQLNWQWLAVAFALFRLFDIWKPYPIRYFDQKLENGFGIMFDDVLAALYAMLGITLLRGILC